MTTGPRRMQGMMLLEALIAILLFSIGILALVSTQATSIRVQADSNYRAEATLLAQQAIGLLNADVSKASQWSFNAASTSCSAASTQTPPALASAFLTKVNQTLPNAELGRQRISVDASNAVTIRLCWRAPTETAWSNYTVTSVIE